MDPSLYLDRNTWVHRLDPRTKMLLLIATFVLAFVFLNPIYELVILALVIFFGYLAKVLSNLRRIRFILIVIAIFTIIIWFIFGGGDLGGVIYGISIAIRIDITIIAGMVFLSTTRNEEVAIGLVRLGIPYRFGFAVSTALRLVPTIASTGFIIGQAQRSRGLDLDSGNLIERIRKYVPLLVPVFVSTIRSTNVFSMALESKGFGASPKRTFYLQPTISWRDGVVLAVLVALLVAAFVLRAIGFGG